MENWQSEYLQFSLFILATVWLSSAARPSPRSPDKAGRECDADQQVGRARDGELAALGARWAAGARALLELAGDRDGHDLARVLAGSPSPGASPTTPSASTTSRPRVSWLGYVGSSPTSGTARCRTGSPSSSPSARWPCSRSTCASAAHPSPSPSARRTTPPAPKADLPVVAGSPAG